MSQRHQKARRRSRTRSARGTEVDKFLNALVALDRTVVQISMNVYQVPQRDRAAMRALHCRLHDTVREHLPRLLH